MRGGNDVIGVVVKPGSALAEEAALRVIKTLEELGVSVMVDSDSKIAYKSLSKYQSFDLERSAPRKLIVVGGDGTLLRTLMKLDGQDSIVMCVRAGKRGFLLDVEQYEIEDRVRDFVEGRYRLVEYPRIRIIVGGSPSKCVLNDVVFIAKMAKMVKLYVYARGERIMSVDGDGLVIATTVGSTAYSLSAGGPIIDPLLNVIVLTPLNAVQLHLRPIVLPYGLDIDVEVAPTSNNLYVSLDGQELIELGPGSVVSVRACEKGVKIARFRWWEGYYERLYTRLLTYW